MYERVFAWILIGLAGALLSVAFSKGNRWQKRIGISVAAFVGIGFGLYLLSSTKIYVANYVKPNKPATLVYFTVGKDGFRKDSSVDVHSFGSIEKQRFEDWSAVVIKRKVRSRVTDTFNLDNGKWVRKRPYLNGGHAYYELTATLGQPISDDKNEVFSDYNISFKSPFLKKKFRHCIKVSYSGDVAVMKGGFSVYCEGVGLVWYHHAAPKGSTDGDQMLAMFVPYKGNDSGEINIPAFHADR